MPKEKFYNDEDQYPHAEDSDHPDLTIQWGEEVPLIKGQFYFTDRSAINRMIKTLRRVRNQRFGKDA